MIIITFICFSLYNKKIRPKKKRYLQNLKDLRTRTLNHATSFDGHPIFI